MAVCFAFMSPAKKTGIWFMSNSLLKGTMGRFASGRTYDVEIIIGS